MPAVKMKAKTVTSTTCKKDGNYPHVSQKSNKISKSTVVRVTDEMGSLAISGQTSQHDSWKIDESSMDFDNKEGMGQPSLSFNGCTDSMGTDVSFNGCTDLVVASDSLSSSLTSGSEATSPSPCNEPNHALCQFEAVNREQFTWEPQLDDNFFTNFQMLDLDSSMYAECQTGLPTDGLTLFDDSLNSYNLSDLLFPGTNFGNDGTEENVEFPTLEETIGAADFSFGGYSEGFQPMMSETSWINLMCHQAISFPEEPSLSYSEVSSDRVDYWDQETFVKEVLELADDANSLPPLIMDETRKRKNITLVLDLDETLIHSSMGQCEGAADFTFQMITDKELTVHVRKRPFLQEFLEKVSEMFEIIIFTASKRIYAEKLLDVLDPDKKIFSRRVYRESCIWKDRRCIKDLTVLGIDLAKVCIIDNTPEVFRFQVNNGIPIKSWFDDPTDNALISLLPFLEKLVDVDDVRPLIAEKFGART